MRKGKILVTGGTGYIGSNTVVELIDKGHDVVIIDDLSNSSIEVLDVIQFLTDVKPGFYQVDLKDKTKTDEVFQQESFDAVIHFAAHKAVGESVGHPVKYYKNNILGLCHLLENMEAHKIPSLLFSSSCTVYGQPDTLPVKETEPVKQALSPYGNTKQIGEEIIEDTIRAHDLIRAISLRYFNPIGAHPSGMLGETTEGIPNNLLPYVLKVASGQLDKLQVFGNDYDTPDGTCIRDYIHVVDLAKAHALAVEHLIEANDSYYDVLNLGTGQGYSVLDIIETFQRANGIEIPYIITNRRPGDIDYIHGDATLANQKLGWKAERDLFDMVKSAWLAQARTHQF